MLTTTASYLAIARNLPRAESATASNPTVQRETVYYLANIGKITSINDFVNNYQVFSYAMKAYGLADMSYAKGLMTKVLEGGVSNARSLANTLADPRYKAFASAFDFAALGSAATGAAAAQTGTSTRYIRQVTEDDAGKQNTGVQLALYFKREASLITSAYGILADPAMLKVVQTAYGLAPSGSQSNIDVQAHAISQVLDVKDLQDPAKVEALVERFTAMWDATGNNTSQSATLPSLIIGQDTQQGLSQDLLQSLQNLKLGGS